MQMVVKIEGLVKEFRIPMSRKKVRAVDGVSLEIPEGEAYGLIGPNGSGKSTTMKVLLGLLAPTQGRCFVFGSEPTRVDSRAEIGYLPENPYFYRHMTGEETLRFYAQLCGVGRKFRSNRIKELLTLVDLRDAAHRRLAGYSKGMLQRIGLAQALIQNPKLIVLDEPTAGVDPLGSRQIRDLILRLKIEGITIFLCSHLLEQVQEVCDQIGIIHRGKMLREGSLESLLAEQETTEIQLQGLTPDKLHALQKSLMAQEGVEWLGASPRKKSLEQLFLEVTQKENES